MQLPRKPAGDPSRPVRTRHPADLLVLAAGHGLVGEPAARPGRPGNPRRRAGFRKAPGQHARRIPAATLRPALGRIQFREPADEATGRDSPARNRQNACTTGASGRAAPSATRKPRSPSAAWTRTSFRRKRWKPAGSPACISSAKSWTSPATSAATTSSGPGPPATPPARPSKLRLLPTPNAEAQRAQRTRRKDNNERKDLNWKVFEARWSVPRIIGDSSFDQNPVNSIHFPFLRSCFPLCPLRLRVGCNQ